MMESFDEEALAGDSNGKHRIWGMSMGTPNDMEGSIVYIYECLASRQSGSLS